MAHVPVRGGPFDGGWAAVVRQLVWLAPPTPTGRCAVHDAPAPRRVGYELIQGEYRPTTGLLMRCEACGTVGPVGDQCALCGADRTAR